VETATADFPAFLVNGVLRENMLVEPTNQQTITDNNGGSESIVAHECHSLDPRIDQRWTRFGVLIKSEVEKQLTEEVSEGRPIHERSRMFQSAKVIGQVNKQALPGRSNQRNQPLPQT
jgi:hypothetical protein